MISFEEAEAKVKTFLVGQEEPPSIPTPTTPEYPHKMT